jgi:hypothetical protein
MFFPVRAQMTDKKNEGIAIDSVPPDMTACMDNFSCTFEASARRREVIVYPSIIAFIILMNHTMHEATGPMQAMGGMFPF